MIILQLRMWSILYISKLWHNKDFVKKNTIEMRINDDLNGGKNNNDRDGSISKKFKFE